MIRAKEFYKTEPKEDLESELADIFYDLVGIAKCYRISLEEAIRKRIEGKIFDIINTRKRGCRIRKLDPNILRDSFRFDVLD